MDRKFPFIVFGTALVAGLGAGVPASASLPPSSAPPDEAAVAAGLERLFDDLGDVTYEGDDITIGDCPLADAVETTAAFAEVADDGDLVAEDEAQIEMFVDYEMNETFTPAAVSCEFESTADDAELERVGVLVADPHDEGVADVVGSLTSSLEPAAADEPLSIGGELRGACADAECLFVWSSTDAMIAVTVEFDDDTTAEIESVTAATRELVTTVAQNVAELA